MSAPQSLRTLGPMKLLAEAKDAAGDKAVAAAERKRLHSAHEWAALAVEIQTLFNRAVELSARG